jgi:hypothetical protein
MVTWLIIPWLTLLLPFGDLRPFLCGSCHVLQAISSCPVLAVHRLPNTSPRSSTALLPSTSPRSLTAQTAQPECLEFQSLVELGFQARILHNCDRNQFRP